MSSAAVGEDDLFRFGDRRLVLFLPLACLDHPLLASQSHHKRSASRACKRHADRQHKHTKYSERNRFANANRCKRKCSAGAENAYCHGECKLPRRMRTAVHTGKLERRTGSGTCASSAGPPNSAITTACSAIFRFSAARSVISASFACIASASVCSRECNQHPCGDKQSVGKKGFGPDC